ncbi:MAG: cell division protein FtsZ [Patescibacteria group bacterium]
MPEVKPALETFAKIKVIGVGGSGNSAVNRMVAAKIRGVDFVAINTDVQALHHALAPTKLHIGKSITRGLGAGMDPNMGRAAAEESQQEVRDLIKGTDMVFITCGLGGGTGTGAAPEVAKIARELGILTVAVVTKPFTFEGAQRRAIAEQGYADLEKNVDTIISIPNDRILQIIDKKTSLLDAFKIVDDVLRQGVQGISEIITLPGLINVDFADVKAIMRDAGSALMGIGRATGENRAVDAAKAAIASPLLEVSIEGARGVLFTITGGLDLAMQEVNEAARVITENTDEDAKIIFGANVDENMKDEIKITVVATGFGERRAPRVEAQPERQGYFQQQQPRSSYFQSPPQPQQQAPVYASTPPARPVTPAVEMPDRSADLMDRNKKTVPAQPNKPAVRRGMEETPELPAADEELEIPAFIRRKMGGS